MLTASLTLHLSYGSAAPYSLLPCPSLAAATVSSSVTCAVAAKDSLVVKDLTGSIKASVSSSGASLCSLTQISIGSCPPGSYSILYSVQDSQGLFSEAVLNVQIEEISVVVLNYTFIPSTITGQDAQAAYANSLTSDSAAAMALIIQQLPQLCFVYPYRCYDSRLLRSASVVSVTTSPHNTGIAALSWTDVTIVWKITLGSIPDAMPNTGSSSVSRRSLSSLLDRARTLLEDPTNTSGGCSSVFSQQTAPSTSQQQSKINPIVSSRPPVVNCATPPVNPNFVLQSLIYSAIVNISSTYNNFSVAETTTLTELGLTDQLLNSIDANYSSLLQKFYTNETAGSALLSSRARTIGESSNATLQVLNSLLSTLTSIIIGSGSNSVTSDSVLQG